MNQQTIQETAINALVQRVSEIANIKLFGENISPIRVRGVTSNVRVFQDFQYFNLSDGVHAVEIKCPLDFCANEGERVIVEGLPSLFPKKGDNGLRFRIDGKITGNWKPRLNENARITLQERPRNKLANYLKRNSINGLLLLGTQVAINDVLTYAGEFAKHLSYQVIRVTNKKDVIRDIEQAKELEASAYAFVRGGDGPGLLLWDDAEFVNYLMQLNTPFYTALGHSHRITVSDQYADESFHAPSGLGEAIAAALDLKQEQITAQKTIESLKLESERLEIAAREKSLEYQTLQLAQASNIEQINTQHQAKLKKAIKLSLAAGILLSFAIVIAFYALRGSI